MMGPKIGSMKTFFKVINVNTRQTEHHNDGAKERWVMETKRGYIVSDQNIHHE